MFCGCIEVTIIIYISCVYYESNQYLPNVFLIDMWSSAKLR